MQELLAGVRAGAIVDARGDRWLVLEARPFEGCAVVTLEGCGRDNRGRRTALLTPFDRLSAPPAEGLRRRHRPDARRAVFGAIARTRPGDGLWSAVDARFDVLPWQLAPALAVIGGATRVLLADAVGLGKTVQAGLILAELAVRGLVNRALVLTPAGLRDQWASELGDRFRLDVRALDQAAILAGRRQHVAGANPWAAAQIIVASIDLVKRPDVRAAVEDEPLDLLIVDEAHHAAPGTDRGAVVARLARRVPWVVLASATPHSGDSGAFRSLLDLGRVSPSDDSPMRVFRRTHHEAGLARSRVSHTHTVTPSPAEQQLQNELVEYARAICRGPSGGHPGARLVAGVLARRATSSALAAERTLARRLDALSGIQREAGPAQAALPWEEADDGDRSDLAWLDLPGLDDPAGERRWLEQLVATARRAQAHPSKLIALGRLLARLREPAIVFTEFRDTLEACLPVVQSVTSVACLHGGLEVAERRRALQRFLCGGANVLLATDVAGEGLNLQTRGRLVITIEWPWSPQRLEQRIGRVDRLGQIRRVHAVHLTARGTFEDSVVARLLSRGRCAEQDLSRTAARVTERVVEARVLGLPGEETEEPGVDAVPPSLDARADAEATHLVEVRRLAGRAGAARSDAAWSLPARRRRPSRAVVVIEVACRSRSGRLYASTVVPVDVTLAARPGNRLAWKHACASLANDPRVIRAAVEASERLLRPPSWREAADRIAAIRRALRPPAAPGVQPSLFDRRAIHTAETRHAVATRLDEHLARAERLLDNTDHDAVMVARPIAVLPLHEVEP